MTEKSVFEFEPKFDAERMFPLRLTPFEEYFVVDSRVDLPTVEVGEFYFQGSLDVERFTRAFGILVAREPLLFAVVKKRNGKLFWTLPETRLKPTLEVERTSEPILDARAETLTPWIDQSAELPGKFRLIVAPDGFKFVIICAHSLVDGAGMARFLALLTDCYRALGRDVAFDESKIARFTDSELLKTREDLHIVLPEKTSLWVDLRYLVSETFLWFFRRPFSATSLLRRARKTPSEPPKSSQPFALWRTLSREDSKRYAKRAKELGVTFNTLALRDLFLATNRWRARLEPESVSRRLRILLPINMRVAEHDGVPMCNILGYAFVERRTSEATRSDELARALESEVREIARWSVGSFFIEGLQFFRAIPYALRFFTSSLFCHATTVFSNLGLIERLTGNEECIRAKGIYFDDTARLVRMVGAPPPRSNTPLAIAAGSADGETTFTFVFDPKVFTKDESESFVDAYWDEITRSVSELNSVE